MHIWFFALNKTALAGNEVHLSVMLKKVSFSKNIHLTWDWTSRWALCNMAGDTLAQVSAIWFWSSSNVGRGIAYTLCFMYLHRKKKSNGFNSGDHGNNSTQLPYPMICCWNVSRRYCWTLDTLCEGRCYVGTINSGGHSTANRLKNWILHLSEVPSIWIFWIPLTCPRKTLGQSVYFCTFCM